MSYELSQSFTFDAAHTLTRAVPVAEYAASRRIHGHTYTAIVTIKGHKGKSGMVQVCKLGKRIVWENVDLFYFREQIATMRSQLDHAFLEEIPGLGPATLENLCDFIARGINYPVHAVTVSRASGDSCRYEPAARHEPANVF